MDNFTTEGKTDEGSIEAGVEKLFEPPAKPKKEKPPKAESDDDVNTGAGEEEEEEDEDDESESETDTEDEDDESDEDEDEESEDDDDDEDSDEQSEKATGRLHTVKVDGVDTKVTLDELKRGYSGGQYVQQGMREAATARKQAEHVYAQLNQERQKIVQVLGHIQAGGIMPPPQEPSQQLFETDPIRYMEERIKYDRHRAAYDQQMGQIQHYVSQQSEADAMARQVYIEGELKQLRALEPEFADPKKAAVVRDELLKVGAEVYGYAPEEIGGVLDHRALRVLRDAARYQAIVKGKNKAKVTQEKTTPKMAKKGLRKPVKTSESRRKKQRARLKQTGSIDDALGLLMR